MFFIQDHFKVEIMLIIFMVPMINQPFKFKKLMILRLFQDPTASPTLTSPLQGYKIAITNLHPVVSQDDIIVRIINLLHLIRKL